MGGKALKSIETRRLHRADFERVSKAVVAGLVDALPGVQVDVIAAYRAKDEFGDLDVLVVSEGVQDSGGPTSGTGSGYQNPARAVSVCLMRRRTCVNNRFLTNSFAICPPCTMIPPKLITVSKARKPAKDRAFLRSQAWFRPEEVRHASQ